MLLSSFLRLIPDFLYKNPFNSWFVTFCLYLTGMFWTYYSGFLTMMIAADITGICLAVTIMTPFVLLYIGKVAYVIQKQEMQSLRSSWLSVEMALPNWAKSFIILIGVLGTAIGLLYMLTILGGLLAGITAGADLLPVISSITSGMATALWVTAVSLASAAVISLQTFIVEFSFEKMKHALMREIA